MEQTLLTTASIVPGQMCVPCHQVYKFMTYENQKFYVVPVAINLVVTFSGRWKTVLEERKDAKKHFRFLSWGQKRHP